MRSVKRSSAAFVRYAVDGAFRFVRAAVIVPTAVGGDTSPLDDATISFEWVKDQPHPMARIARTTAPIQLRFRSARADKPDRLSITRNHPHAQFARFLPAPSRCARPGRLGRLRRHEPDRLRRNRAADRLLP